MKTSDIETIGKWWAISTAPKDGRIIEVRAQHDDIIIEGPHLMSWDSTAQNPMVGDVRGLWVAFHGAYTWDASRGFGPTEWRDVNDITVPKKEGK